MNIYTLQYKHNKNTSETTLLGFILPSKHSNFMTHTDIGKFDDHYIASDLVF